MKLITKIVLIKNMMDNNTHPLTHTQYSQILKKFTDAIAELKRKWSVKLRWSSEVELACNSLKVATEQFQSVYQTELPQPSIADDKKSTNPATPTITVKQSVGQEIDLRDVHVNFKTFIDLLHALLEKTDWTDTDATGLSTVLDLLVNQLKGNKAEKEKENEDKAKMFTHLQTDVGADQIKEYVDSSKTSARTVADILKALSHSKTELQTLQLAFNHVSKQKEEYSDKVEKARFLMHDFSSYCKRISDVLLKFKEDKSPLASQMRREMNQMVALMPGMISFVQQREVSSLPSPADVKEQPQTKRL